MRGRLKKSAPKGVLLEGRASCRALARQIQGGVLLKNSKDFVCMKFVSDEDV